MKIYEIARMDQDDFVGGRNELSIGSAKGPKPLPGGSGLLYTANTPAKWKDTLLIKIWDPKGTSSHLKKFGVLVGMLSLEKCRFPMKKSYEVSTITIDEDYRGRNLSMSLYGIALSILGITLVTGDLHTPAGAAAWLNLSKIPGVEVLGWIKIDDDYLEDKDIDVLMGELGAQYIGVDKMYDRYFWFEVGNHENGREMKAKIKTHLSNLYPETHKAGVDTGMFARWVP